MLRLAIAITLGCLGLAARVATAQGVGSDGMASGFTMLRADGNGVTALRTNINVPLGDVTVALALETIAERAGLNITFDPRLTGLDTRVSLPAQPTTVAGALLKILEHTGLTIGVSTGGQLVVVKRPTGRAAGAGSLVGAVRDAASGEPIADARVELIGTRQSTASRSDGSFELRDVPAGTYDIRTCAWATDPSLRPRSRCSIEARPRCRR
jgi:hypothetical protein